MRVLPAVDLMGGATVQLRGGDPDTRLFEDADPVGIARSWVDRGAHALHVVDLDAALDRGHNAPTVKAILDAVDVPVQVGGGVRETDDIRALLDAGAARVVVGTRAWTDPAFLADAAEAHPDRVLVAVETRGGQLAIKGWTETTELTVDDAIDRIQGHDLGGVLATCIDVEGRSTGPDTHTLTTLCDALDIPIIGSGGVATPEHVASVRDAGCAAVVVGTALYTGELDLTEAQKVANDEPGTHHP